MGEIRQTDQNGPIEGRDPATGRFGPGNKGGGRPAVSKRIREVAQQYGDEAIEGLLNLARDRDQPGAVRRAAWADILDRGFGRPTVGEPDENGQQPATVLQVVSGVPRGTPAADDEPDGLCGRGA